MRKVEFLPVIRYTAVMVGLLLAGASRAEAQYSVAATAHIEQQLEASSREVEISSDAGLLQVRMKESARANAGTLEQTYLVSAEATHETQQVWVKSNGGLRLEQRPVLMKSDELMAPAMVRNVPAGSERTVVIVIAANS